MRETRPFMSNQHKIDCSQGYKGGIKKVQRRGSRRDLKGRSRGIGKTQDVIKVSTYGWFRHEERPMDVERQQMQGVFVEQ